MVDIETLKCFAMLDVLSGMTENGYLAFSELIKNLDPETTDMPDCIVFDDSAVEYVEGDKAYPVVLDVKILDDGQFEVLSSYDQFIDPDGDNAVVRAIIPSDKSQSPYVTVMLRGRDKVHLVIIEEGRWAFTEE